MEENMTVRQSRIGPPKPKQKVARVYFEIPRKCRFEVDAVKSECPCVLNALRPRFAKCNTVTGVMS
jgi:hypothetical protein